MAKKRPKPKYKVTYTDPEDPRGMRDKTHYFRTRKGAVNKRDDLAHFWRVPKKSIPIRQHKPRRRRPKKRRR